MFNIYKIFRHKATFFAVLIITLFLAYISFFGVKTDDINILGAADMRFGIDIRGGVDAVFQPKNLDRKPTTEELEAARAIIDTRLDNNNVVDREVTTDKENGFIFVRFPWKSDDTDFDPDKAIAELGEMAKLTFKDPDGKIIIEGKHIDGNTSWEADTSGTSGTYLVHMKLTDEGRELFHEATARLVNQAITIYMDETVVSSPTVKQEIDSNECVISDISTADEARKLSNQINSGALPFSLETKTYDVISPTLGSNALSVMVWAGILAFILICLYLMFTYRLSGLIASIALLLQVAGILLMIIWPQFTITLSGIAGIILSIGMGVDANIIISERIREELRSGKRIDLAVSTGFKRAFSSVFDGNVTVLIVAVIMLILGSGAILSFAFTLLFGIIMNFVAGVFATRMLTMSLIQNKFLQKIGFFMSKRAFEKKEVKIFPFYAKRKIFFAVSGVIIAVGIVMMFVNGVELGIEFKGGSIVKYDMSEDLELDSEKAAQIAQNTLDGRLTDAAITTDFTTKTKRLVLSFTGEESLSNEQVENVTDALQEEFPEQKFSVASVNNVAAYFSSLFLRNGIISLILSMILIIAYVWFSFRKIHGLSAGVMALLALLHDVIVVFFTFVIFRIPIGDMFIAVALTILGYSINDTIVIYDRIRENRQISRSMPYEALIDKSISQSFTRSLNTSIAVFASVLIVYIFAVANNLESIREFALPMCIGTVSGCYSTVCLAGPLWAMWERRKEKKRVKKA